MIIICLYVVFSSSNNVRQVVGLSTTQSLLYFVSYYDLNIALEANEKNVVVSVMAYFTYSNSLVGC